MRGLAGELPRLLRLALPIVLVQIGTVAMGVVDTIMVGRVSATALAAVALGNIFFFAITVFGTGCLLGLDPLVAQAVGAGDERAVALHLQRGLQLSLALSVPISLALLPGEWLFGLLEQPPEVVPEAARYARASIPGVLPLLVYTALRQTLQALHRTAPVVWTIVGANVINAGLNLVLIFGALGGPAMGAVGSAWASTISRTAMALGLWALAWRDLAPRLRRLDAPGPALRGVARVLGMGAPIGASYVLEIGALAVMALLMGWLGTDEVAGHQVALNLSSLTFMVPLGVSAATAVRVGHAVGRRDPAGARVAAGAGLLCGGGFMSLCTLAFVCWPGVLARAYTDQPGVLAVAMTLLPIAGVFQVFDGLQVVAAGALRGLGDTRAAMVVTIVGFWLVGMPVSVVLAFRSGSGPAGLWWGLVAGLAAVAIVLVERLRRQLPASSM